MSDFLWVEKYRPQTISECILPDHLKATFQSFVDQRFVPTLLLAGPPGVGKTTVAKALLNQLDCDSIVFNGSLNVDKATLRNDIAEYASAVSMLGGRKYIILDEADYLSPNHVQPALRSFMEEFSDNCGFILTCNWMNKIMEPLRSRCAVIDFQISKKDRAQMASEFLHRCEYILKNEGVEYDKRVVAEVISKYFPDWRRVLNELQRYSVNGVIDEGILALVSDNEIKTLLPLLKTKDFTNMRKWVGENSHLDTPTLFKKFYNKASELVTKESIPPLVMILADYQYKSAFVADQEINMAACFTQLMIEVEFK
jgi:DNA polymerase III delta prime subunit